MSNIDKQEKNGVVGIVHGRSCKACTLCCKVLAINELEKPREIRSPLHPPHHQDHPAWRRMAA